MKSNLFVSGLRTVVPIAAGLVLALAARVGLDLDSEGVTAMVTAGFVAGYYLLFRLLEEAADRIGIPWLHTLAGIALGFARPPQYVKPITAPLHMKVQLDFQRTADEAAAAMRDAMEREPRGRP